MEEKSFELTQEGDNIITVERKPICEVTIKLYDDGELKSEFKIEKQAVPGQYAMIVAELESLKLSFLEAYDCAISNGEYHEDNDDEED